MEETESTAVESHRWASERYQERFRSETERYLSTCLHTGVRHDFVEAASVFYTRLKWHECAVSR